MSLFGLFKKEKPSKKSDLLLEKAEKLVQVASANAAVTCVALFSRFPFIHQEDSGYWHLHLTIANVYIATNIFPTLHLVDKNREDALMGVVANRLNQWNPLSLERITNCKGFCESIRDQLTNGLVATDDVGIWVVWAMVGHRPQTEDEQALMRGIGIAASESFSNWWVK